MDGRFLVWLYLYSSNWSKDDQADMSFTQYVTQELLFGNAIALLECYKHLDVSGKLLNV